MTKRFGEVIANDSVSLEVWPGEVHCLLGENGAGKSTLIAMLAGLQQPDDGSIEVSGTPSELSSPAVSQAKGIGVVYQHSTLIPTMTVIDNLLLARHRGFWLDRAAARIHLAELSDLLGAEINPESLAGELGLGQQQQLEIATAMRAQPTVLVLDEPTSMLSAQGIEDLMASIRRLTTQGVAVIFVTHKLDEALALGDRITVLREGRVVRRLETSELRSGGEDQSTAQILAAMFGADTNTQAPLGSVHSHKDFSDHLSDDLSGDLGGLLSVHSRNQLGGDYSSDITCDDHSSRTSDRTRVHPRDRAVPDQPAREVLSVEAVSTAAGHGGTALADVTLRIRAGEIVGVAGIDGHGQRHLAEVIAGQRATSSGSVLLDGRDITRSTIRQRQGLGVRYVTDDRLREGIVGSLSVALNLLLKRIGERPFWRFGRMDRAAVGGNATELIEQYGIRASSPTAPAGTLSGGNIQKILLARELSNEPRVVVFHKPTYGLDLKTVLLVREEIVRLAREGRAVLLISTDLDELTALADRVEVLSHGRIVGQIENNGERVRERVGALMVGGANL